MTQFSKDLTTGYCDPARGCCAEVHAEGEREAVEARTQRGERRPVNVGVFMKTVKIAERREGFYYSVFSWLSRGDYELGILK